MTVMTAVRFLVWSLMGFLMRSVEDIHILLHGGDRGVKPLLTIEGRHRRITLERRLGPLSTVGGSINGIVDGILGECNHILEAIFDATPSILNCILNPVDERLRLLGLNDNLVGELFIRDDEGCSNSRKRQESCGQLHVDRLQRR